jgi:transcriptional regulator with XRE-family HTH domain
MTQAELSLATGISQSRLSRIENGLVVPRLEQLAQLCDALSADLEVSIRARA